MIANIKNIDQHIKGWVLCSFVHLNQYEDRDSKGLREDFIELLFPLGPVLPEPFCDDFDAKHQNNR
jgi:hypothetical protein